ncbi:triose-phosphate isomerase, partial [Thermophilibacter sp.]
MRKRMIAGNWKMNKTYSEGVVLAQGLADELADGTGDVDVVVCPPAVDLKGVSEV